MTVREKYLKALDGGKKMLERAAEIDRAANRIKLEVEYDLKNPNYVQAITMSCIADEMREFYELMFT